MLTDSQVLYNIVNMFEITDLMFGDYFQNSSGAVFRMTATIFMRYINDNTFSIIFSPVKLTDEILENNFPNNDILSWWKSTDDTYQIEIETDDIDSENTLWESKAIIRLKYVHELQHLLKDYKVNKDIKLR